MRSTIKEADINDLDNLVGLLKDMSDELKELSFDEEITNKSIACSFTEGVHWFLFLDENKNQFGTCYLQSVHNYWRAEKRYYLGGFYIAPDHRGKGYFREITSLLKDWVSNKGGVQIYTHIHKENQKSMAAFKSSGMEEIDYKLFANHWGD